MKRIVLTGGPGAGKSVISQRLAAAYPQRLVLVPEAASQVYTQLQTRWDRLDIVGRRDVQRRIYRLQLEQEARIAAENPGKAMILDRGSVDGAAYWPEGPDGYWHECGTTAATELGRYDFVLWLETSAILGIYDADISNACRFEDPATAIAMGRALFKLWSAHPNLQTVGAYPEIDDKFEAVEIAVTRLLDI